eukprot:NODE_224_length_13912_cov_0.116604.p8 type:complete len:114 gc:universal NODE_224_length_13912_cov_0.116604:3408-3749(+)
MNKISIPENMNSILMEYALNVIKEQPLDINLWSASYFENLNGDYASIFCSHIKDWNTLIDLPDLLAIFRNKELQNHITKETCSSNKEYLQHILNYQHFPHKLSVEEYLTHKKK